MFQGGTCDKSRGEVIHSPDEGVGKSVAQGDGEDRFIPDFIATKNEKTVALRLRNGVLVGVIGIAVDDGGYKFCESRVSEIYNRKVFGHHLDVHHGCQRDDEMSTNTVHGCEVVVAVEYQLGQMVQCDGLEGRAQRKWMDVLVQVEFLEDLEPGQAPSEGHRAEERCRCPCPRQK